MAKSRQNGWQNANYEAQVDLERKIFAILTFDDRNKNADELHDGVIGKTFHVDSHNSKIQLK